MLKSLRSRIAQIRSAPKRAAAEAAPEIQRKFRNDARTQRGNVPSFGKMGNVLIVAEARPESIAITGPAWCVEKARELNETQDWRNIAADAAGRALRGDK